MFSALLKPGQSTLVMKLFLELTSYPPQAFLLSMTLLEFDSTTIFINGTTRTRIIAPYSGIAGFFP
jgi:hypothetical protein